MNDQERLKLAVDLAQKKLSELREGDLLNLRDDFQSFFAKPGQDMRGPIGEIVIPFEQPLPQNYTIEDFEALQKETYAILSEIVGGRDRGLPSAPTRKITAELTVFSFPSMNNQSFLQAMGSTRDMFLLRLYLLLAREPLNRILRCKRADCDQIFYRVRKQKFCSTQCQSRDFMRQFRKTNADKESEQNHRKYKKRVEKARGRPTKINRRARGEKHGN